MFGKKPGIPLDKIPPTVGLNSASVHCSGSSCTRHSQLTSLCLSVCLCMYAVARVDLKRSRVIFWDLGGQVRQATQHLVLALDAFCPLSHWRWHCCVCTRSDCA